MKINLDAVRPLSNNNGEHFDYCMKPGAVLGPFTDKDKVEEEIKIPEDQDEIKQLTKFQQRLLQYAIGPIKQTRVVKVIVDILGRLGKSTFMDWCERYHPKTTCGLVATGNIGAMQRMAHSKIDRDNIQCIIINIPCGVKNKKELREIFTWIEMLKDGKCVEDRYKYQEMKICRPKIIVLMNSMPQLDWMVADRWDIEIRNEATVLDDDDVKFKEDIKVPTMAPRATFTEEENPINSMNNMDEFPDDNNFEGTEPMFQTSEDIFAGEQETAGVLKDSWDMFLYNQSKNK